MALHPNIELAQTLAARKAGGVASLVRETRAEAVTASNIRMNGSLDSLAPWLRRMNVRVAMHAALQRRIRQDVVELTQLDIAGLVQIIGLMEHGRLGRMAGWIVLVFASIWRFFCAEILFHKQFNDAIKIA